MNEPIASSRLQRLQQLVQRLGLSVQAPINWRLLDVALTHSTASAEANYERLEFVGDAVVKLAAAEFLFAAYPTDSEGNLSAIRSQLVSDRVLAQIADSYGIDRFLLISASALADKLGQESRLAAALEAVLAALYLSTTDLSLIHPWLDRHFQQQSDLIRQDPTFQNYKGALQMWTQAHYQRLPDYRVTEISQRYGDAERFQAEVWFQGQCWGQGKGSSRKAAEQVAARIAFLALRELTPDILRDGKQESGGIPERRAEPKD